MVSAYHGSADKAEWCSSIERDPEVEVAFRGKVRAVTCIAVDSQALFISLAEIRKCLSLISIVQIMFQSILDTCFK